jgi:uncharacterized protein (TIGR02246 family)
MKLKMRHLPRSPLLILALAGTVVIASVAPDTATASDQSSSPDGTQSPEFKQVQEATQKYIEAYNKGDAKALAEFYAQDVDYIDQDGAETKGREAIEKLLAANFQANPGITLNMTIDEVKLLTPDVRVNRGVAVVTPKDGAAVATRYVAINLKKGDRWLISQLTETDAPAPNAYSRLQELEWLVGDWENKAGDLTVETKIEWAGDKNFLTRKGGRSSAGIRSARRFAPGFSTATEALGNRPGPTTANTG